MSSNIKQIAYVIISPAYNEETFVEKTIQSVISQTVLPLKWVIVSDGSTDRTDEIVNKYRKENKWIELIRLPAHRDRQFAAKVKAFNAGYEMVKDIHYDVIGNLDADISFEPDYFEFLINKFEENPTLGVAGTPFIEDGGYSSISDSFEGGKHVAGGCQLFRKSCFEDIGGYIPNKAGGIDWIAVTTARMKGWRTQSFPEKVFHHHRSLGTGNSNKIISYFNYGRKDYYLGNHPLWEAIRILYRCSKKPFLIGGLVTLSGYFWAFLTRTNRPISKELMKFHRDEEMRKLKAILSALIRFKKINKYEIQY
jgi:glycosyltransferase involved in cell wall biosynthesis